MTRQKGARRAAKQIRRAKHAAHGGQAGRVERNGFVSTDTPSADDALEWCRRRAFGRSTIRTRLREASDAVAEMLDL